MHQKFDITLKDLWKDVPVKLLKFLTGFDSGKSLDNHLTNVGLLLPDLYQVAFIRLTLLASSKAP